MKFFDRPVLRRAVHPLEYSPEVDEHLAQALAERERHVLHSAHLFVR